MTTVAPVPSKKKLWFAAIKPPMYTVAVIPITAGTALAYYQTQQFNGGIFALFLLSAIFIIAWLNISNDVFDAETGIDQNKHHSIVNLTGNKSLMFWLSNLFLVLGFLGVIAIDWWLKDWTVLGIIMLCCALGYSYQGPPFRLGYQGLGEIICFICFGPLAIAASYYSQTQLITPNILPTGIFIGISTSIILFCSHFHQVEDDLAAGKKSPIVRLGTFRGFQFLTLFTLSLYGLTVLFILLNLFPIWTLSIFLSFPFAWQLIAHVYQYHGQPEKIKNGKFIAVNLHFISGLLLSLGLILPNLLN
ncbi:MAG: 2-carboxy-1,4-naphthoquinone phytyltransferase [Microcystaceae cyanobacterium]